jgi:hypothetical protein
MPSEKLKQSRPIKRRESVYADDWSDEDGDRSLSISRDPERLYIAVYRQLGGKQEIHLPITDLVGIISALQRTLEGEPPNKAPEPTTMAVTSRAPSSTSRASHGRGSS